MSPVLLLSVEGAHRSMRMAAAGCFTDGGSLSTKAFCSQEPGHLTGADGPGTRQQRASWLLFSKFTGISNRHHLRGEGSWGGGAPAKGPAASPPRRSETKVLFVSHVNIVSKVSVHVDQNTKNMSAGVGWTNEPSVNCMSLLTSAAISLPLPFRHCGLRLPS